MGKKRKNLIDNLIGNCCENYNTILTNLLYDAYDYYIKKGYETESLHYKKMFYELYISKNNKSYEEISFEIGLDVSNLNKNIKSINNFVRNLILNDEKYECLIHFIEL